MIMKQKSLSMKKVLIVILCVMFHIQYVVGQCHIIEGDYVRDKSYEFITIKGNRLYYIERQPHLSIRNSDTLAICDVRIIDDHVIEINSTYKEEVERNMMITQVVGDEMVDSIDLKFDFPYSDKHNPWKMQVYYNITASPLESYDFHIKIPADSKGFFFEIFPAFCVQHLLDGHYWGLLYYLSDPYEIKERCKSITVSNYMLNAGFFERYYPKNEYLYVKGKEIHWKGKIFKRIKKRQKWM